MLSVGVIGTAGRDWRLHPYTKDLFQEMCLATVLELDTLAAEYSDTASKIRLVSGGAAWADHVAVTLFRDNLVHGAQSVLFEVNAITLHLPARLHTDQVCLFKDPQGHPLLTPSAAKVANGYHREFSRTLGESSLKQIAEVIALDDNDRVRVTYASAPGFDAFKDRNYYIARDSTHGLIALTFSETEEPHPKSGTGHTWNLHKRLHPDAPRIHISLHSLLTDKRSCV